MFSKIINDLINARLANVLDPEMAEYLKQNNSGYTSQLNYGGTPAYTRQSFMQYDPEGQMNYRVPNTNYGAGYPTSQSPSYGLIDVFSNPKGILDDYKGRLGKKWEKVGKIFGF